MPPLIDDITQTYLKATDSKELHPYRWLDLAAAKANRGGRDGIAAFLRCALTIAVSPALAYRRDALVIMLMKMHGANFIRASLHIKNDLKPQLNTYIQNLKERIKKGK